MRDLADGQAVDSVFEVRELTRRQKRNGDPFLKLQLGDVDRRHRGRGVGLASTRSRPPAAPGAVVRVSGRFSQDDRATARASPIRAACAPSPGEYDPADLLEGPPIPVEQMAADLDELIATVQEPHLCGAAGAAARRGIRDR